MITTTTTTGDYARHCHGCGWGGERLPIDERQQHCTRLGIYWGLCPECGRLVTYHRGSTCRGPIEAGESPEETADRWHAPDILARTDRQVHDRRRSELATWARETCTADDLLAIAGERRLCEGTAACGGQYYESEHARRPIVREAVERMRVRQTRRRDRQIAEQARSAEPGRILRLAAEREQARRAEREARILRRIEPLVRRQIDGLYRTATAGDHTLTVRLGEPRATGESSRGDRYSRRCTWRRTDSHHRITVPERWKERVYDRGLARIGGHFCLDARKVRGRRGQYDVVLAVQEAGFSIGTQRARVLIESELPAAGEDDRVQITLPRVVAHSREGTVVRDDDGRVVQVVVYCPTTGERHHLTVPPRFGRRSFGRGESEADRVHAAIAWTFGLRPEDYRPAVQS